MHNISTLIEQLEKLVSDDRHCVTAEFSTGEGWSVSIAETEFHPETENPGMRWLASDETNGYGATLAEALADALGRRPS